MIPVVRKYHRNPVYLRNIYHDDYCGGKMENYSEKVNVVENENDFQLEIIAPGYERDELKVTIDKDEITIASVTEDKKEIENQSTPNYLRREFIKDAFSRTFKLPENVEADKVEAAHKNGILTISLPKRAKVEIPVQQIEVK